MSDVAKIASGLTKAMRVAVTEALGGGDLYLTRFEHGRSADALVARKLAWPRACRGAPVILTPLGLAVRAHLLENHDG